MMIGERIRAIRKQKGMTQKQIADKCGMADSAIRKYESGVVTPKIETLQRIAEALEVPINCFYGFNDPQFPAPEFFTEIAAIAPDSVVTRLDNSDNDDDADIHIDLTQRSRRSPAHKKSAPTLTEKDRRDIARDLEEMMAHLDSAGDLMFDGDPMSDEARESIRAAMKLGLEAAKLKNKERFTPKKFRKG